MRNSRRIFLWLLLALFCAPLVIHAYLGSYSRFIADDFCSSAVARSQGIFRGSLYWYINWNGRYSANLLDSLFGYIGPAATPLATGLVITAWLIVLAIAVGQIKRRHIENWIVAAMVLFAVLHVIPLVGQSLYWGQGMRSVVPPLILGAAYVALIAKRSKSTDRAGLFWLITAGLLTFIAVGFAETYFAVQTTAIVFAFVIPAVFKIYAPANRRNYFLLLIAGLAGSLAGGLLMFVAPGNKFRQGPFPPPPAIPELLRISLRGMREFFELVVLAPGKWYVWVALILCGFIFGLQVFQPREGSGRRDVWTLIWLPVVAFVLLLACWVPMAWATSLTLGYRTFIIPAYVLVCLVTCWAYIAGRNFYVSFAPRAVALPLVVLLAFGILAANISREMFQQRSLFIDYARRWDERDQIIRRAKSQGLPYAVVPEQHNLAGLDEVEVDPKNTWLTKCMSDYYGINVIPELGDLVGEPNGRAKQAALVREFDAIQKLPGSIPTELNQIYRTERGKIGFYNSDQSEAQIKSYYDNELARLGWKYIGEKKVEKFGKFSGGSQFLFCNGEVAATLFTTASDEAWLGYTYSLALNWGMSSGYTWGVIDCQADR